jgi:hypothetical protein
MSKPNGKPSRPAAPAPAAEPAAASEPPPQCSHASAAEADAHAMEIVRGRQCAIVQACCREAEQGSYLHARFVFEFAGIAPSSLTDAAAAARERSLTEELLAKLQDEEFCLQLSAAHRAHPLE